MLTSADTRQVSILVVHVIADTRRERRVTSRSTADTFAATFPCRTASGTAAPTTVLLIDDDGELAGLLGQLFAREGMTLGHSARGTDGIALAPPPERLPISSCST